MPISSRRYGAPPSLTRTSISWLAFTLLLAGPARSAPAQTVTIPLIPSGWSATDSIRFEEHLGRPSLYINRGAAVAAGPALVDGTLEFDMAATEATNFLGATFHAASPNDFEVIFFRVRSSGTMDAVQYAPALNGIGAAWQVYHGPGANASAVLPRGEWIHVRIVVSGVTAELYLNHQEKPTLTVPRLAGVTGRGVGVWAGGYGRGAWFSNLQVTPGRPSAAPAPVPPLPRGTITEWRLSEAFEASATTPGRLPDLAGLTWEPVRPEPEGFVLINRFRRAPTGDLPVDSVTREVLVDSVMGGRVAGTRVVYARTTIRSERKRRSLLRISYSDGVMVYCNGTPLYLGMNPPFFRGPGQLEVAGEGVFLPLEAGANEIVLAVTEYSGGWVFSARLDP